MIEHEAEITRLLGEKMAVRAIAREMGITPGVVAGTVRRMRDREAGKRETRVVLPKDSAAWRAKYQQTIEFARQEQERREELEARRGEADRARAAREQHWLTVEREKYGLKRSGLPLSRQPA